MSESEHGRYSDELAAYLLGALEPGEAAELERHLADCGQCRTELEWLRPAVQLLPESVERQEPSPQLREGLMAQVRREAGARVESPAPSRADKRGLLRGWVPRPVTGFAALALIVAVVAAFALSSGGGSGGKTTTTFSGHAPGVTAEMVSSGDSATLHLADLHQLPQDEVLQAWIKRDEKIVSAKALFEPNADGTASATIDDMSGVEAVMVTAEPHGGSVQPTSSPIVSVSMPN